LAVLARIWSNHARQSGQHLSDKKIIIELFQAEKNRYEGLMAALKNEIDKIVPPPRAVWVQSTIKEIDEPLILGVLHEASHLTNGVRQLRSGLHPIEQEFDLTIEIEGYTKAEIPDLDLGGVNVLYGVMPRPSDDPMLQPRKKALMHREKDLYLNLVSRKLASMLEKDASLVRRAKNHIDRLLKENQGAAAKDLMEWRRILDTYSIRRLVQFLTSDSERALRLRQSSPFFAVLNDAERKLLNEGLETKDDS
jgi:hypothetical protein